MIKKFVLLVTVGTMILATSCKKQEEMTAAPADANAPQTEEAVVNPNASTAAPMPETATATAPPANGKYPVMEFANKEHDFGTISAGDKVSYTFNFKNTGESDLIITNAVGSCGCTVPEYPKEPVKPGESGKMKVSFNSEGKNGAQQKTVTVTANTQAGKEIIAIKANVNPKA